ncbi:Crp/Fnr family transcriptional regulator [soil metagenome]
MLTEMPAMHGSHAGNGVLAALRPADLALLAPHLCLADLAYRERLYCAGQPFTHVYFPVSGIASAVLGIRGASPVEIGLIGREGIVGFAVLLGETAATHDAFMQAAGQGWRLPVGGLKAAAAASPSLQATLLCYVHVFMCQAASTALANGRATLTERLARWLLMAQDRLPGCGLPFTHDILAMMLGVRRAGVTTALQAFERSGLIVRTRALIEVVDRPGLCALAGGYYGQAEAAQERLLESKAPA